MTRWRTTSPTARLLAAGICLAGSMWGCAAKEEKTRIANPFAETLTIAVAPILNFSGEFDLDPVKAADLLASELSAVEGIAVLPVNRVVAVLATEGKRQIESPAHALAVAEAVGADAILVAGITEYDAYTPVVGLALQLYALPDHSVPALDPVAASRQAQSWAIAEMSDALQPAAQVQVVYNGAHKRVVEAVRRYADPRSEPPNPLGWRQYLKVQSLYLRFCWHDALERLMDQERIRQAILADAQGLEDPA